MGTEQIDEATVVVAWMANGETTRTEATGPREHVEEVKAELASLLRQEVRDHFEATGEFVAAAYQEQWGDGEFIAVDTKTGGVNALYLPPDGTPECDAWHANWRRADAAVMGRQA